MGKLFTYTAMFLAFCTFTYTVLWAIDRQIAIEDAHYEGIRSERCLRMGEYITAEMAQYCEEAGV